MDFVFAATLLIVLICGESFCSELARGWGDQISWTDLESGLAKSAELNKPLMLVIHKSWCGACKSLKPKFAESAEIADLSEQFVMVNVVDDEEPKDKKFAPDGGYIPRIFFLSSQGEVQEKIYNEGGSESYKYYYYNPADIVKSMRKALSDNVAKEEL